jgi:hypothetical protein
MPHPVSVGMAEKKASNAANPPADAPIPTMGNPADGDGSRCAPWSAAALTDVFGVPFGLSGEG